MSFVAEKPEHAAAIEEVLDRAFGPGRYAKTSERVRERGAEALSRVALDEVGAVIGVCRIWRVQAGAPAYFLGPLAVDPAAQSAGVGVELVRACVAACRAAGGAQAILAVGAEAFFASLGFGVTAKDRVRLPGPVNTARALWLGLRPGGLDNLAGEIVAPRK